jgi:hypothetical protein
MRSTHLLLLLALACARSTPPTTVVGVDQDVVLTPRNVVAIANSDLRLSFERVSADSRCPSDVVCVWAGNATAHIRVTNDGQVPREFAINSTTAPMDASFDGFHLKFVSLTPVPVSTAQIDPKAYRLTVRLERP